jgi:hypothetical protein
MLLKNWIDIHVVGFSTKAIVPSKSLVIIGERSKEGKVREGGSGLL